MRLFPDSEKTRVVFSSSAEELFYNTARKSLGDGWRVYFSVTLSAMEAGEGQRDNEMDFVCYHPQYGVLVVEVKGGRIRTEDGKFYSVNRHGESFEINNPFQQALVWKSRFVRFLRRNSIKVPVTHAVCFPSVGEDEFPPTAGIEPGLIIGRNRIKDLEHAFKTICESSQPERFRSFDDVGSELDKLLVGSAFTSKLYLRDYIDGHEQKVKDVESVQETLITPISGTRRLAIEGEAGTGKTMLALLLARTFRDRGQSVLLLSSNGLLNLFLKREAGPNIDVQSYTELAASFGVEVGSVPADFTGTFEDWLQYEGPDRLKKAVLSSERRYDVLICDEAQDVQPFWWEPIEALLKNAVDSSFYVFFDRSQGVFGSGGGQKQFVPEDGLPIKPPYFPLVHNYRTTREIAAFSRAFRTGNQILQSHCGRLGYIPELVVYDTPEECRDLLGRLVRKLVRDEGMQSDEVTLLSARNPDAKESVLFQTAELGKYALHKLSHDRNKSWRDAKAPKGSIGVSTIQGFKGLETQVGIMMNLSEYNLPLDNPIMSSLVYVACTRAKHMLYVFVQKNDPKRALFEGALSRIKCTGSIVLGSDAKSDFEFIGTVTHYSPERVGWLTVEDPAFSHGSVMFFPHDVAKAGIQGVKVGQSLRFRPRVEGQATIATDLALSGVITLSEGPDSSVAQAVAQAVAAVGPAVGVAPERAKTRERPAGRTSTRGGRRKEPVIVTKKSPEAS